jgi:predicted phosphodiesterase
MKRKIWPWLLTAIILVLIILYLGFVFKQGNYFFKSNLARPSPALSVNNNSILSFAVIGDPESDLASLQKAGEILNQKGIKYAVLVGDLTSSGTEKQFQEIKAVLDSWGMTYFTIPGNHDLWLGRSACQKQPTADCSNVAVYKKYFGANYYQKIIDGFDLFLLDNSDEYLGMGDNQLSWLRSKLLEVRSKYFGFFHIPLYSSSSEYVMGYRNPELKKEALDILAKLCQNPPLAMFFGHLHHSRQYEYSCTNGQKLKMFNVGSINSKRNWQLPRLLLMTVKPDSELATEEIVLQ